MSDARGCPKADIRFCPLYVASHSATLCRHGCASFLSDDTMRCDIPGAAYAHRLAALRVEWPGFVEGIEWREDADQRSAQRLRNQRANGIH